MARAPFQVLVLPFVLIRKCPLFAIFRRSDSHAELWQGIAGGGEDDETPLEAAKRESREEANISGECAFFQLESMSMLPVENVAGFLWGPQTLVIPEWSFGVEVQEQIVRLSHEHREVRWLPFSEAMRLLTWESNRTALWELNHRISNGQMPEKNS